MRKYAILFKNESYEHRIKIRSILESHNEQIYIETESFNKDNDNKSYPYFMFTKNTKTWSGSRTARETEYIIVSIDEFLSMFGKKKVRQAKSIKTRNKQ